MNIWIAALGILAFGLSLEAARFASDQRHARAARRRAMREISPHLWSDWRWSQDGYVRHCRLPHCPATQYGGDDYGKGPDNGGVVQAG